MTYLSGILYYLSATVNPVLYNIMSNKFREAFKVSKISLYATDLCWASRVAWRDWWNEVFEVLELFEKNRHMWKESQTANG